MSPRPLTLDEEARPAAARAPQLVTGIHRRVTSVDADGHWLTATVALRRIAGQWRETLVPPSNARQLYGDIEEEMKS